MIQFFPIGIRAGSQERFHEIHLSVFGRPVEQPAGSLTRVRARQSIDASAGVRNQRFENLQARRLDVLVVR
jgi:hypothetical protein